VAFYEHLADSRRTLAAMPDWVAPDIFENIAGLLAARIGDAAVAAVRSTYRSTIRGPS
jgi:hypothetical protein